MTSGLFDFFSNNIIPICPKRLSSVSINQREIAIDKLFAGAYDENEILGVEELKERRAIVSKLIDEKIQNHPRKTFFVNRKLSLLEKVFDFIA